jgi:hypothetical protein
MQINNKQCCSDFDRVIDLSCVILQGSAKLSSAELLLV